MLYYITIILVLVGLSVSSPIEERIVGGERADNNEFPFVVSVRVGGNHVCGGVLIDLKWILTAAHCVLGKSTSSISVQYGLNNIGGSSRIITVKAVIIHDDYKPDHGKENDLALLELPRNLQPSESVQVACLAGKYATNPTEELVGTAVGWGYPRDGGAVQTALRKVENLKIYTNEECSARHYKPIVSTDICAGDDNGERGQCTRDAGGPIIADGCVVGIIAWSIKPCTVEPHPGVSMRVSSYICWINRKTRLSLE